MTMDLQLGLLADHPEAIAALALGYEAQWPDWYGSCANSAADDLRRRARRTGLPLGVVALRRGLAVGTCALTAQSGPNPSPLTPWIGGLWVSPGARRQGVATALIGFAAEAARQEGFDAVHALTADAVGVFGRLGWVVIDRQPIGGELYSVMRDGGSR